MYKDTDDEIWREIKGFEGQYSVSNKGNVKNIKTNRILIGKDNNNGYRAVTLKGNDYNIHRLVALAFIPNPDNLPQVDHVDENKRNNRHYLEKAIRREKERQKWRKEQEKKDRKFNLIFDSIIIIIGIIVCLWYGYIIEFSVYGLF